MRRALLLLLPLLYLWHWKTDPFSLFPCYSSATACARGRAAPFFQHGGHERDTLVEMFCNCTIRSWGVSFWEAGAGLMNLCLIAAIVDR